MHGLGMPGREPVRVRDLHRPVGEGGVAVAAAVDVCDAPDAVAFAPLVVQAGVFLTPVGYPLNISGQVASVLAFNPVSGMIEAWRWTLLDLSPNMFAIAITLAWTLGAGLLGWYVFGRMETRFADYV